MLSAAQCPHTGWQITLLLTFLKFRTVVRRPLHAEKAHAMPSELGIHAVSTQYRIGLAVFIGVADDPLPTSRTVH